MKEALQSKINELQENIRKNASYAADIDAAIKKLRADKITATNNNNILLGAVQAYTESLKELEKAEPKSEVVA